MTRKKKITIVAVVFVGTLVVCGLWWRHCMLVEHRVYHDVEIAGRVLQAFAIDHGRMPHYEGELFELHYFEKMKDGTVCVGVQAIERDTLPRLSGGCLVYWHEIDIGYDGNGQALAVPDHKTANSNARKLSQVIAEIVQERGKHTKTN